MVREMCILIPEIDTIYQYKTSEDDRLYVENCSSKELSLSVAKLMEERARPVCIMAIDMITLTHL